MMALGVGGERGKALQAIVQSLHHSSELEAWGLMVEASEEFQKTARRLRLSAHPENTWFSNEERELFSRIAQALQQKSSSLQDLSSVQEPSSNDTIDIKKIEAALEGLLDGTTSAATMETTLGDMLPTMSAGASGHRLALSGREDSYQQHTSSLTDMDEEFSSALAGKAGSLVRRKETMPGYSYLTISIDKIGLKDPQDYIDPAITVSVKNLLGKDLEAVQITPVASERETSYIVFGNEVEIHSPLEEMPSGAAIFFEFKHYKPKKGITSTRCFSFMEMDEVKPGKSFLEIYKKPTDFRRKKLSLLSVKPLYLHLTLKIDKT